MSCICKNSVNVWVIGSGFNDIKVNIPLPNNTITQTGDSSCS